MARLAIFWSHRAFWAGCLFTVVRPLLGSQDVYPGADVASMGDVEQDVQVRGTEPVSEDAYAVHADVAAAGLEREVQASFHRGRGRGIIRKESQAPPVRSAPDLWHGNFRPEGTRGGAHHEDHSGQDGARGSVFPRSRPGAAVDSASQGATASPADNQGWAHAAKGQAFGGAASHAIPTDVKIPHNVPVSGAVPAPPPAAGGRPRDVAPPYHENSQIPARHTGSGAAHGMVHPHPVPSAEQERHGRPAFAEGSAADRQRPHQQPPQWHHASIHGHSVHSVEGHLADVGHQQPIAAEAHHEGWAGRALRVDGRGGSFGPPPQQPPFRSTPGEVDEKTLPSEDHVDAPYDPPQAQPHWPSWGGEHPRPPQRSQAEPHGPSWGGEHPRTPLREQVHSRHQPSAEELPSHNEVRREPMPEELPPHHQATNEQPPQVPDGARIWDGYRYVPHRQAPPQHHHKAWAHPEQADPQKVAVGDLGGGHRRLPHRQADAPSWDVVGSGRRQMGHAGGLGEGLSHSIAHVHVGEVMPEPEGHKEHNPQGTTAVPPPAEPPVPPAPPGEAPHEPPQPVPSEGNDAQTGHKEQHEDRNDAPFSVDPNSVLVMQSKLFLEKQLGIERDDRCREKGDVMGFVVTEAKAQITDAILVSLNIVFSGSATPQKLYNIQVHWLEYSAGNHWEPALNQVRSELESMNLKDGPVNVGAKLVIPEVSACDWPSASSAHSLLSEDTLTDQTVLSFRPMGLDVGGERAFYERLMRRREEGIGGGPTCSESVAYPQTHDWRKEKPLCLDYVHDQGTCGACYMFAAVDSVSDRHCINAKGTSKLGLEAHLSNMRPLVCMKHPDSTPCVGGTAELAYNYVYTSMDVTEAEWEYEPACFEQPPCAFGGVCSSESAFITKCPDLFSPNDQNEIETWFDAFDVAKRKCGTTNTSCQAWVRSKFFPHGSVAFYPNVSFCNEVTAGFGLPVEDSESLIEDDSEEDDSLDRAYAATQQRREKFWPFDDWFGWGRRRTTDHSKDGESASDKAGVALGTEYGLKVGSEVYWKGKNESLPEHTKGVIKELSVTHARVEFSNSFKGWYDPTELELAKTRERMLGLCNKGPINRCPAEGSPKAIHSLTSYYAVPPKKACFKEELYNFGPFFLAFWVYTDFTAFFAKNPLEGYSRQVGMPPKASWPNTMYAAVPKGALGGHAVVIVGWEGDCKYHVCDADCMAGNLIQEEEGAEFDDSEIMNDPDFEGVVPGASLMEAGLRMRMNAREVNRYASSSRRRRVATGECWVMRNSWSDKWADEGYFRMYEKMLTGEEGEHIFITSHAAYPKSK